MDAGQPGPMEEQELILDGLAIVGRLFWGPDTELCAQLWEGPVRRRLAELGGALSPEGVEALEALLSGMDGAGGPEGLCEALETEYVRRFVSDRGGIPAPLYHSCYQGEGTLMGPAAIMMAERLDAAGISLEGRTSEPPDHLAVEVEYLVLTAEDDPAAAAGFGREEMLPWLSELCRRLGSEPAAGLYPPAARLLLELVRMLG